MPSSVLSALHSPAVKFGPVLRQVSVIMRIHQVASAAFPCTVLGYEKSLDLNLVQAPGGGCGIPPGAAELQVQKDTHEHGHHDDANVARNDVWPQIQPL